MFFRLCAEMRGKQPGACFVSLSGEEKCGMPPSKSRDIVNADGAAPASLNPRRVKLMQEKTA